MQHDLTLMLMEQDLDRAVELARDCDCTLSLRKGFVYAIFTVEAENRVEAVKIAAERLQAAGLQVAMETQ